VCLNPSVTPFAQQNLLWLLPFLFLLLILQDSALQIKGLAGCRVVGLIRLALMLQIALEHGPAPPGAAAPAPTAAAAAEPAAHTTPADADSASESATAAAAESASEVDAAADAAPVSEARVSTPETAAPVPEVSTNVA
jgi:hypothetical protein